jgi:hypothetical protein
LKRARYKKLIGVAVGEASLLVAEVCSGQRPQVRKLAEMDYPAGSSPREPVALGQALGKFLGDQGFTAGAAVVGIPVKWLAAKPKEVPPTDAVTLANMLRLQAESEFSSELKDMVYEYAGGASGSVLLLATPKKHVEWATQMCQAAKLKLASVTPSALALGVGLERASLVLTVGASGSELTARSGGASSALRHLRSPEPRGPFVSELRRTVSTLPRATDGRDIILWEGNGLDAKMLEQELGVAVRRGELGSLGVDTSVAGSNGDGHRFAPAVALAVSALSDDGLEVDFLHSRLAPPRERRVPRWAIIATLAGIALIGGAIYAYFDLQTRQADLDKLQTRLKVIDPEIKTAKAFVSKVSVAQAWHGGEPQYLACLRDLTEAIPEDGQTYATTLTLSELAHQSSGEARKFLGHMDGKTSDEQRAQWLSILDRLKRNPAFTDVTLGSTNNLTREREVSFSITFTYDPSKALK